MSFWSCTGAPPKAPPAARRETPLSDKCALCGHEGACVSRCETHGPTGVRVCKWCMPAWRKLGKCPTCRAEEKARAKCAKEEYKEGFLTGAAVMWLIEYPQHGSSWLTGRTASRALHRTRGLFVRGPTTQLRSSMQRMARATNAIKRLRRYNVP
jgi:hypothetical protein